MRPRGIGKQGDRALVSMPYALFCIPCGIASCRVEACTRGGVTSTNRTRPKRPRFSTRTRLPAEGPARALSCKTSVGRHALRLRAPPDIVGYPYVIVKSRPDFPWPAGVTGVACLLLRIGAAGATEIQENFLKGQSFTISVAAVLFSGFLRFGISARTDSWRRCAKRVKTPLIARLSGEGQVLIVTRVPTLSGSMIFSAAAKVSPYCGESVDCRDAVFIYSALP